jgi:preprotein translocase subunit SecG
VRRHEAGRNKFLWSLEEMSSWLLNVVVMIQILTALVMIGLVLVQHGKGADMGASFGSGASGSLFGATGSANFLSRSTAVCAGIFFVCTLALAYIAHEPDRAPAQGSVLDRPMPVAPPAASGAAQIPSGGVSADAAGASSVPASGAAAIPTK